MKKSTQSVQEAIEPFILEDNMPAVMERLYPLLSFKGKQEVKKFWKENKVALTIESFNVICDAAQQLTGIDIRNKESKNKKTTLAQFLVSFALYEEFVVCKKATLKEVCQQYMPSITHSQILYAVHAIEKSIHLESAFDLLNKFCITLATHGLNNCHRRLVILKAIERKKQTIEA